MKINIQNLTFKCILGIIDFERKKKQRVVIDLHFTYKFKDNEFINYADIADYVESTMKKEKFLLIEDALLHIKKDLESLYCIKKLKITICKPNILKNSQVSVTL